ncbi:TonB-dependent receptor [Acetobacter thailandicus]|uniref:TonB-dependent receptor n=1 Tax=Acetobacter thailandicus TaxID=1502842 RepID=UPI001BA668A2|nr:TonB-dependent receptor [Acetobacter thailandicus]MBS0986076.1 TonB-dependent receptor [Acetobacter thailandicus]
MSFRNIMTAIAVFSPSVSSAALSATLSHHSSHAHHYPGAGRPGTRSGSSVRIASAPARPRTIRASGQEEVSVHAHTRTFEFNREQHEPGSTTFLSAQTLQERHVTNVLDLQQLVPNLTIQSEGGSSAPSFYLRGIGMQDYTQNNMPSVMTYFDGVAYPVASMSSGMMFDVSSVAVQAGPVGFTHGLADTGGEVRIESNAPTKTFHYGVNEDLASYYRSKTTAYISGPITSNLQYRIAGQTLQGGAFRFNRDTGQKIGNANVGALRGRLAWQPDAKTNIDLIGSWSMDRSDATASTLLEDLSNPAHAGRDSNIYATSWSLNPKFANLVGISPKSIPSFNNVTWNIALKGNRDLGFAHLKTLSSFSQQQRHEYVDRDALEYRSGDTYFAGNTNVFAQQVILEGKPLLKGRFHWLAGLYYNRVRSFGANWFDMTDYTGYFRETSHNQPQQNFSQFATLAYDITKKLNLQFSLEHQSDDRQLVGDTINQYYFQNTAAQLKQCGGYVNCTTSRSYARHGSLTNQFSGKVSLSYQFNRNILVYASVARGVKPGGFATNTTVSEVQVEPFKPEWVMTYEAGAKTEFFDQKLRINGTLFYNQYHDKQMLGSIVIPGVPTAATQEGIPGMYSMYVNVPHSKTWGTEINIAAHPIRGLSFSQNIGYLRGTYTDYQQVDQQAVAAHYASTGRYASYVTSFNGSDMGMPKLTLSGSASYDTLPLWRHYKLNFEVNYSYRTQQNSLQPRGSGLYVVPSYFLLGASVTFRPLNNRWFVTAYASNLTGRRYLTVVSTIATTSLTAVSGDPRFVGGRFGFDF